MSSHSQLHDTTQVRVPRAALVVAHPGHELRVHGWLEETRPIVCVLTDGSGRTGHSRLSSTTRVLDAADAYRGPIYGQLSDADFYTAVLEHEHSPFLGLVEQLASLFTRERIEILAGDAAEGYNPTHDICRLLVDAAVRLLGRTTTTPIANYDFALVGPPDYCPEGLRASCIRLELDEEAFARKLSAALNYPELRMEVDAALSGAASVGLRDNPDLAESNFGRVGAYDFRIECLRPVMARESPTADHERPFYENYGERQVKAGHYKRVLRYREHVLPLALALNHHIEKLS